MKKEKMITEPSPGHWSPGHWQNRPLVTGGLY